MYIHTRCTRRVYLGEHRHIRRICASLFFVGIPLPFPPLRRVASVSLLLTCHHMTPFSRPKPQLDYPKRYTNRTELHKSFSKGTRLTIIT